MNLYTDVELINLNDEKLQNLFFEIRSSIFMKKRKNEDTRDLEVYFCYISRELQYRNDKVA